MLSIFGGNQVTGALSCHEENVRKKIVKGHVKHCASKSFFDRF